MLERTPDMRVDVKIIDIESLIPQEPLLRKTEKVVDFDQIYGMVEHLYSADNVRPSCDPVMLVKMVFLQHLYGIRSLRQTMSECSMNIAYRGFCTTAPIQKYRISRPGDSLLPQGFQRPRARNHGFYNRPRLWTFPQR